MFLNTKHSKLWNVNDKCNELQTVLIKKVNLLFLKRFCLRHWCSQSSSLLSSDTLTLAFVLARYFPPRLFNIFLNLRYSSSLPVVEHSDSASRSCCIMVSRNNFLYILSWLTLWISRRRLSILNAILEYPVTGQYFLGYTLRFVFLDSSGLIEWLQWIWLVRLFKAAAVSGERLCTNIECDLRLVWKVPQNGHKLVFYSTWLDYVICPKC